MNCFEVFKGENLDCILFINQLKKAKSNVAVRLEMTSALLHRRVLLTRYLQNRE